MPKISNPALLKALAAMWRKDPIFVLRVIQFYDEARADG